MIEPLKRMSIIAIKEAFGSVLPPNVMQYDRKTDIIFYLANHYSEDELLDLYRRYDAEC